MNYTYLWGQYESYWISFYRFCEKIGIIYDTTSSIHLQYWANLSKNCAYWYPYDNICIVCNRPEKIEWNDAKTQLHCEDGPSVKFRDGWSIWSLNGVLVPQWLVETPTEQMDLTKFTEIDNAEVRREFVRKVGIDRICHNLSNGPIDKTDNYELHKFNIPNGQWTYLKMLNPSLPEIWHVEGIPNEIQTIQEALNFRNGFTQEEIDDKDGVDWYQQGDVLMKPKGATKFKSRPIVLT